MSNVNSYSSYAIFFSSIGFCYSTLFLKQTKTSSSTDFDARMSVFRDGKPSVMSLELSMRHLEEISSWQKMSSAVVSCRLRTVLVSRFTCPFSSKSFLEKKIEVGKSLRVFRQGLYLMRWLATTLFWAQKSVVDRLDARRITYDEDPGGHRLNERSVDGLECFYHF